MNTLLKIFGIPVSDTTNVSEINITFHGLSAGTAVLIGLVLIAATIWIYIKTTPSLSARQKGTLAFLRSLLIVMILLMLMRPTLLLTVEGTIRRSLLVLIDASASMQIKDLRQDPEDIKRAAIAKGVIDSKNGLKQSTPGDSATYSNMSRADIVKGMLTNSRLNLYNKLSQTYDVVPYTFGQSLQAMANGDDATKAPPKDDEKKDASSFLDSVKFDRPYTAIGDAVRGLLDLKRGQPLAGVLLITDGNNNYGSQPADAAALAAQDKVPVFVYGVGISSPHDIVVSSVYSPEVVFAKEEAQATVTIHSQSMANRSAKLVLKLADKIVDTKDITFGEDGEQSVQMKFNPPAKGEYELEASIEPLSDEAVKDNNKASQRVRVIDGKIQVLYVEQKPRWEYRFLQAMLVRDRRLDAKFYLAEGDPELSREQGSPFIAALPTNKNDWMKYDVIIIGDVNSRIFNDVQMQAISELVSTFGGGLILLSGKNFMPDAYRRTPLESLFPIIFEGQAGSGGASSTKLVPLDLTPAGQSSSTMRLDDNVEKNLSIWKGFTGIYWDARVTKAKPSAEVLLNDPSPEKATRTGAMPVLALQSYGTGQVLFVGTDETWRWRRNIGEKYYTRFWGQVMLRLGLPRLLGASRLTQLTTDKKQYVSGERVSISGRLYRPGFQPVVDSAVKGTVTIKPDDANAPAVDLRKDVSLQSSPGKPGYYEGELVVTTPGIYTFATANDPASALEFKVSEPRFEFGETALNLPLLKKMAESSGGALFREEDMYRMLEQTDTGPASATTSSGGDHGPSLGSATIRVPSPQEVDLAFSPTFYGLMILVATIEWFLRKRWRLK